MFKDKRKKPKKSKFNYGEELYFTNIYGIGEWLLVNCIKRYGKRTFMYSDNGRDWVSEYRLEEIPF